jgi:hypothetical protein
VQASKILEIDNVKIESWYNSVYTSGLELKVSNIQMIRELEPPIAEID